MKTVMIAAALISLSACSTGAALVRKDPTGGRVALQGGYMPAMLEARELMVEHCYGRFEMLELGDAVEFRCRNARTVAPEANTLARAAGGEQRRGL